MPRIPTTAELAASNLTNLENRVNQQAPLNDISFMRVLSGVEALTGVSLYKYGVDAIKGNLALTAIGARLEEIGSEHGVTKKPAVATVLGIQFTGSGGAVMDETNAVIGVDNGMRYTVDASAAESGGVVNFTVTAEEIGVAGNLNVGLQVRIEKAVAGLARSGVVTSVNTLGVAEEEEETYRDRVLFEIRTAGGGGNPADYKRWPELTSGVKRAFPYGGNPVSPGSSTPPERTVYIEAQAALDVDGIPSVTLLAAARADITTDPETGKARQPLGLTDDTLYVEPITRRGMYVEIRALVVASSKEAACKSEISSKVDIYLRSIVPYVDGVDVEISRNDTITGLTLSLTVQRVLEQYSATAAGIGFGIVSGTFLPEYQLAQGEKSKLLVVTYA